MPGKVLIMDTSALCCLLEVPGKDIAGNSADGLNYAKVSKLVEENVRNTTFVLPLASLIETGNHVAQAPGDRFSVAKRLADIISRTAAAATPWAAFTDQADLWGADRLESLAQTWPELAKSRLSIGDATIKNVAEYYAQAGFQVEIITGDAGLKAYEPPSPPLIPRRRQK